MILFTILGVLLILTLCFIGLITVVLWAIGPCHDFNERAAEDIPAGALIYYKQGWRVLK